MFFHVTLGDSVQEGRIPSGNTESRMFYFGRNREIALDQGLAEPVRLRNLETPEDGDDSDAVGIGCRADAVRDAAGMCKGDPHGPRFEASVMPLYSFYI